VTNYILVKKTANFKLGRIIRYVDILIDEFLVMIRVACESCDPIYNLHHVDYGFYELFFCGSNLMPIAVIGISNMLLLSGIGHWQFHPL
jgi:hypothetical protein